MRSSNPVLSRPDAFTPQQQNPQGYQQYGQPQGQYGYQQPGQPYPGQQYYPQDPVQATRGVMTIDDVITKSAITMGTVIAVAAITFMFMPATLLLPAMIVSALVGFVTVMIVAARRVINPGAVLAYAAIEGVFIGAVSKIYESAWGGIVPAAVMATLVTAGATLAVYKFFRIKVTSKFRKMVMIGTMSLLGVLLVNFVLALFGVNTGLREVGSGAGMLAILVSVIAVALAVANLIVDFDSVERGIAQGAPAQESWRAALGITVTMVWLYVEILRILSYFRD